MGRQGEEHEELVLRIQTTHHHQRVRNIIQWALTPGKIKRLITTETQGLHPKTIRKVVCKQGLHKSGLFEALFCG